VGAAALCARPGWRGLDRVCAVALALVVLARLAFLTLDWQPYGRDLQSLRQVMLAIPAPSIVAYVDATNGERMGDRRRCEMFGPLLTPLKGHVTEVFANGAQQPVAALGRLKRAEEETFVPASSDPEQRTRRRFAALAAARAHDYVLTCDEQRLGPAPPGVSLVARAGRFALYRPSST
jgi:hypothetical protein